MPGMPSRQLVSVCTKRQVGCTAASWQACHQDILCFTFTERQEKQRAAEDAKHAAKQAAVAQRQGFNVAQRRSSTDLYSRYPKQHAVYVAGSAREECSSSRSGQQHLTESPAHCVELRACD